MTPQQQQIIDNLVSEFNKLQPATGKSFNLINTAPLIEKSNLIKQLRREEELSYESWIEAAQIETRRIVELLADDLPTIDVSVYGYAKTGIKLFKSGRNSITIYVKICSTRNHSKEFDEWYNDYTGLEYSTYVTDNTEFTSNSIEDLLSHNLFLENLRKML